MCGGGGNATAAAQQQEQERQAQIASTVDTINKAFAGRTSQYNTYLDALRKSYGTQLNYQQANAQRNLKFSLARAGLTGGSVAADQGGELTREAGAARIGAEQQAQAKTAALQSSDEATRQQMISLAQSGASIGEPGIQTANMLAANLGNAQANLAPDTLGNVFGGVTNSINAYNTAAQTRLGLRAAQAYTGAFSNAPTTNAGYANTGAGGH